MDAAPLTRDDVRARIVATAAALLQADGAAAVTTRAVAHRAGVQAPTIYRLFGDKDGLLDAVVEHALAEFGAVKSAAFSAEAAGDPVDDLRRGWDMTIRFGLAHPDLFVIMSDPRRGRGSPATAAGMRVLAARVRRVAAAGRLRVPEAEAIRLVHAAGTGAVLTLLETDDGARDEGFTDAMFDAVLGRILTDEPAARSDHATSPRVAALTLRAVAADLDALSPAERSLLVDWLDRVIAAS